VSIWTWRCKSSPGHSMKPTLLLYMEDVQRLQAPAVVVEVKETGGGKIAIALDQTVFYPKGGGQPFDTGSINSPNGAFAIDEVRFADGIVHHVGRFVRGNFSAGEEVTCIVDEQRRDLNSRLHSAGHVVDMAIHAFEIDWVPGKGYHFPDGPYIEYSGSLDSCDVEQLQKDIEEHCNRTIGEGAATAVRFMDKKDMASVCHNVPDYIPKDKPSRVVMYGDFGVPCGGTHVGNLFDIKHITIRKIKEKKGVTRIAYDIPR
jgi:Ser-tRNA(Ala) deacylase AlaX